MRALLFLGLLALAACASTPPAPGSHQADADTCGDTATASVEKADNKRFLTWLASPATRFTRIGRAESACMTAKGWSVTRACTDDELQAARQGHPTPEILVTSVGIRCRDPGRPS